MRSFSSLQLRTRYNFLSIQRCCSVGISQDRLNIDATPLYLFHDKLKTRNHVKVQFRSKVFVSRHNQSLHISAGQIIDFCSRHLGYSETQGSHQNLKTTPTHVILKECPFCTKPTNDKIDNLFKLYIQIGGGAYFCHRCGAKGSWFDFTQKLGSFDIDCSGHQSMQESHTSKSFYRHSDNTGYFDKSSYTACLPMPQPFLDQVYRSNLFDDLSTDQESHANRFLDRESALHYLTKERGLKSTTLRLYGVGLIARKFPSNEPHQRGKYIEADCITFPWIMRASDVREQEALRGAVFKFTENDDGTKQRVIHPSSDPNGSVCDANSATVSVLESDESTHFENDQSILGNDETVHYSQNHRESTKSVPNPDTELKNVSQSPSDNPFVTRRIKLRAVRNKAWQRLEPTGGGWSLFGFHTVPVDAKEIVITEGEYDAMAVYQATKRPSVSLPNGCRSLPDQVLPLLERFEKIYLWMDNDGPGREGAEQFSKKLGLNRCYLVQPTSIDGKPAPKDANEALLCKYDLEKMIQDARVLPHHRILTFSSVRSQVIEEILNPNKYAGIQLPSLPVLNGIVKGFRRGEMTVLTGPTGSGKTTFLGQISLDFAEQGHSTLWGSFEIKNTRLLHKLMQQFSREPLIVDGTESINHLNAVADRFESLPLYFMKFHGGTDVDDVLDAMDYAAYVHDVQHIILDNLQFMISRNQARSSFDKFDYQDLAIEKFRKFATERNVHVTVVVHPRKEDEYSKLGISSIFGSAKATQEADTVLILQYDGLRKYIEVKKNRFDGALGHSELHFQRKSGRYTDQPDPGKLLVPTKDMLNNKRQVTGVGTQSIQERILAYNNLQSRVN